MHTYVYMYGHIRIFIHTNLTVYVFIYSGVSVEARVLATLLTEMDGISSGNDNENVIVMAATNRIDCIDSALLRKGRFHHILLVPPPNKDEKILLLKYFCRKCELLDDDYERILTCEGFQKEDMSGAEVENLCREEVMARAQRNLPEELMKKMNLM
jgi:SpoVK/Ycf46/Vps4 family AAA+-type ATPase